MKMSRYAVLSLFLIFILGGITFGKGMEWVATLASMPNPFVGETGYRMSWVIGMALALIGFVLTITNQKAIASTNGVVNEMDKVSWPSKDETTSSTLIVLATIVVSSLVLGLFDTIWLRLTDFVLSLM